MHNSRYIAFCIPEAHANVCSFQCNYDTAVGDLLWTIPSNSDCFYDDGRDDQCGDRKYP